MAWVYHTGNAAGLLNPVLRCWLWCRKRQHQAAAAALLIVAALQPAAVRPASASFVPGTYVVEGGHGVTRIGALRRDTPPEIGGLARIRPGSVPGRLKLELVRGFDVELAHTSSPPRVRDVFQGIDIDFKATPALAGALRVGREFWIGEFESWAGSGVPGRAALVALDEQRAAMFVAGQNSFMTFQTVIWLRRDSLQARAGTAISGPMNGAPATGGMPKPVGEAGIKTVAEIPDDEVCDWLIARIATARPAMSRTDALTVDAALQSNRLRPLNRSSVPKDCRNALNSLVEIGILYQVAGDHNRSATPAKSPAMADQDDSIATVITVEPEAGAEAETGDGLGNREDDRPADESEASGSRIRSARPVLTSSFCLEIEAALNQLIDSDRTEDLELADRLLRDLPAALLTLAPRAACRLAIRKFEAAGLL